MEKNMEKIKATEIKIGDRITEDNGQSWIVTGVKNGFIAIDYSDECSEVHLQMLLDRGIVTVTRQQNGCRYCKSKTRGGLCV
jgi:hypothetical protein